MRMLFNSIEGTEPKSERETDPWLYAYKKDRPADRALLVIYFGKAQYLDHIGPGIDYYLSEEPFKEDEYDEPNGVYIWEGNLFSVTIHHPDGDYDVECELSGTLRPATPEEWQAHVDEEYLWDRSEWLLPECIKCGEPSDNGDVCQSCAMSSTEENND